MAKISGSGTGSQKVPQSTLCDLCRALKAEAKVAKKAGEAEREKLIRIVLAGHEEACHGSN
jgi:hypothetical protein